MYAWDKNDLSTTATSTVTINIVRNANAPALNATNYEVTIHETQELGQPIIRVTAVDGDVCISD